MKKYVINNYSNLVPGIRKILEYEGCTLEEYDSTEKIVYGGRVFEIDMKYIHDCVHCGKYGDLIDYLRKACNDLKEGF